jgi:hypothetical protein
MPRSRSNPSHMKQNHSLTNLLHHAERFYADRHLLEDFECLTAVAESEDDVAILSKYRRLRRSAPGFCPGSYRANNHARISPDALCELIEGKPRASNERQCESCLATFTSVRSDAKFCSARCRVRSHRRGGASPQ